jgi:multidrug resistance efflux pump
MGSQTRNFTFALSTAIVLIVASFSTSCARQPAEATEAKAEQAGSKEKGPPRREAIPETVTLTSKAIQVTELDIAQKSFERARLLVASKAMSDGEFQQREGDYLSKRAAVSASENALRQAGDNAANARRQSPCAEGGAPGPRRSQHGLRTSRCGEVHATLCGDRADL